MTVVIRHLKSRSYLLDLLLFNLSIAFLKNVSNFSRSDCLIVAQEVNISDPTPADQDMTEEKEQVDDE
jgi:hypothetical protein